MTGASRMPYSHCANRASTSPSRNSRAASRSFATGVRFPLRLVSSITHTFPGTSGPELVAQQAKQRASPLTWIILRWGPEHRLPCLDAHGVVDLPYAIWRPPLPAGSGINQVLRCARWGRAPVRWFTPHVHSDFRPSMKFRLANSMTIALGRAFGSVLPWPEPATRAKVRRVLDSGASIMTDYGAAEMGRVAIGCPNRAADGDVHVLLDAMAIIGFPREIPSTDETVTAFHITALNPSTPKLLFNAEFDDCGVIEERACGCPLESLGLTQHLREIRSFGKLVARA